MTNIFYVTNIYLSRDHHHYHGSTPVNLAPTALNAASKHFPNTSSQTRPLMSAQAPLLPAVSNSYVSVTRPVHPLHVVPAPRQVNWDPVSRRYWMFI